MRLYRSSKLMGSFMKDFEDMTIGELQAMTEGLDEWISNDVKQKVVDKNLTNVIKGKYQRINNVN